jgi:hypothetical protein
LNGPDCDFGFSILDFGLKKSLIIRVCPWASVYVREREQPHAYPQIAQIPQIKKRESAQSAKSVDHSLWLASLTGLILL